MIENEVTGNLTTTIPNASLVQAGDHPPIPKKQYRQFFTAWANGDTPKEAGRKAGYASTSFKTRSVGRIHRIVREYTSWALQVLAKANWDKPHAWRLVQEAYGQKPIEAGSDLALALAQEGVTIPFLAKNIKEHMEAKLPERDKQGGVYLSTVADYNTQGKARRDVLDVMGLRKQVVKHEGGILHVVGTLPIDFLRRQIERDRTFRDSQMGPALIPAEVIEDSEVEETELAARLR